MTRKLTPCERAARRIEKMAKHWNKYAIEKASMSIALASALLNRAKEICREEAKRERD